MKLWNQVVSLELSRKLNELGVKQQSLFYWHYDNGKNYPSYGDPELCLCGANYSAFTASELSEMLPTKTRTYKYFRQHAVDFDCIYEEWDCANEDIGVGFIGKTEANARAKMLIHLIENKLMEVPKCQT